MNTDFKDFIRSCGYEPPDHIPTEKITPFAGLNKPKGNKAARCFLFADGQGGWFCDYSTGLYETWQAKHATPYTDAERKAFTEKCQLDRAKHEREQLEARAEAAKKACEILARAIYANASNAYLHRKNIKPHKAKTGDSGSLKGVLILPLYNELLQLVNLQFIQANGEKRFLSGGQKKSCFWWIGNKTPVILLCEGFATGASLFESTGNQVFIAYDASNLINVAKIVRAKNPLAEIIIAGDNDVSGTGQTAARAAALAINGKYILPPTVGHDWNDHINTRGKL
jgi:putative DNA primase/helicase